MQSVILYEMLEFYDHGSSALPSAPVMLRLAAYSAVAVAKVVSFTGDFYGRFIGLSGDPYRPQTDTMTGRCGLFFILRQMLLNWAPIFFIQVITS